MNYTINMLGELIHPSTKSVSTPVETQNLMEKVRQFVLSTGGNFALTMTPTVCEVRYQHANGICAAIATNDGAPSDMISDVMNRAQDMFVRVAEAEKEIMEKAAATGGRSALN